MRRLTSIVSIILFFVWCLPLGAFIKPSEEKEVCNGRRAICLCTHLLKKRRSQPVQTVLKNGHPIQKETSAFSSPYFDTAAKNLSELFRGKTFLLDTPFSYSRMIIRSIDHVPKIAALYLHS